MRMHYGWWWAVTTIWCIQFSSYNSIAVSAETINVLVLLIQWANHADRDLIPRDDIDTLWNGPRDPDTVPGEFINAYIGSNSYGKYQISATVLDWYLMPETEELVSNGKMGNSDEGEPDIEDYLLPVLEDAVANKGINLEDYNRQGDDYIRGIVFMHSGYAAENGGQDCETGADYLNRIQSRSWGVSETIGNSKYTLSTMVTVSAYRDICNLEINRVGVAIHEWMHAQFGLEDFYDTGGRYNGSRSATGGIGAFGIMSFAGGQGYDYAYPGLLNPYAKMQIDALEPQEITEDGIYSARPSAIHPDIYIIKEPYEEGEYLLIENRQPVLSDLKLWSPGGIVIYHIDENQEGYGNFIRGGPFVDGWPDDGAHYKVAVLQADPLYELEQAINLGHNDDFWKEGDVLGPGNGETVATQDGTYPNTDSYVGGNIRVTDLILDLFTPEADGVWSFRVQGLGSSPSSQPSQRPSPGTTESNQPSQAPSQSMAPSLANAPDDDPDFYCNCASHCVDDEDYLLYCDCDEADECCEEFENPTAPTPPPTAATPPSTPPPTKVGETPPPTASPSKVPTQMPSAMPSLSPSVLITNKPTADRPDQCMVSVSKSQCTTLMADKTAADVANDECDCYNFCNGVELPCCPHGEECLIDCDGDLVSGCEATDIAPTPPPTPPPTPVDNDNGDQCSVSVNIARCASMDCTDMQPVQDCDCYNFCSGQYYSCCPAGEACGVECDGAVVAGCPFEAPEPTAVPATPPPTSASPTADPGPSTFFFWPSGFVR